MADKKKVDKTKVDGPIWVSASGAIWVEKPTLDADDVLKLRENYYWAATRDALKTLVYRDRATYEVLDPDLKPDEARTTDLERMCDRADLWSKICTVLPDWYDWGLALWNDVWDGAGTAGDPYELRQVRRIDPYSLRRKAGEGAGLVRNEILPGIVYDPETGETSYHAADGTGYTTKRLENVIALTDPTVPELGGRPMIRPAVSVIRMLDFTHGARMQQVNRVGAPVMFIRMATWTQDDIDYAQKILNNWGKDTGFVLRPGMELVGLPVKEGSTASDIIDALAAMVIDYFSPAKLISKNGTLIGGSATPELDITYSYIGGIHRKIEANIERLLQPWLVENGWDGYTIRCHIPSPAIDRAELNLKIAAEMRASGLGDPVQYLALLGMEGYSTEEIEQFAAWWSEHGSTAPAPLGFASAITNARATDVETHGGRIAALAYNELDKRFRTWERRVAAKLEDDA